MKWCLHFKTCIAYGFAVRQEPKRNTKASGVYTVCKIVKLLFEHETV